MATSVSRPGLREIPGPVHTQPRDRHGRVLPDPRMDRLITERARPRRSPTLEAGLARAAVLFDAGHFFESHQHLHHLWQHHAASDSRAFWKAVTQVAAACVHTQRGNEVGARTLFDRAAAVLADCPSPHQGLDVDRLLASIHDLRGQIDRCGASAELDFPALPRAVAGRAPR